MSLKLSNEEFAALLRFHDTCADGEGYDVPKAMMRQLAQRGAVRRVRGSVYEITLAGQTILDAVTQPCGYCQGEGFTDEGDPEIGQALMDCQKCTGKS